MFYHITFKMHFSPSICLFFQWKFFLLYQQPKFFTVSFKKLLVSLSFLSQVSDWTVVNWLIGLFELHITFAEILLTVINYHIKRSSIKEQWSSGQEVNVLVSTGWFQGWLSLSSFRGRLNEYQEIPGIYW